MMVPKNSLLLAGAALALFGAASSAQSQSGKIFTRVNKPLKSATLDLASGTMTRGPAVSNRAATTVVDFFNTDLGGFVGVDTGGGFCEWFDAGVKGSNVGDGTSDLSPGDKSPHLSDLMNSIVFAYCSAKADVASGGPGGSVKLGFYEGYTTGGPLPATTNPPSVAVFTLTGLPANTASSSFFGGFGCYFIRVFFGTLIPFADGPIGYSWKFLDNGTGVINPAGATLAATFPFLSCVTSCSGVGPDGQGMDDLVDEYCPAGTLRATFSFGTTSGSFTSVNMDIEEAGTVTASTTSTGLTCAPNQNPDVLTGAPCIVGQPWSASLTLGIARTKGSSWQLFFGTAPINPPCGTPIAQSQGALNFGSAKGGRMLLCAINTSGFVCTGIHGGSLGNVSSTNCGGGNVPSSLSLICSSWCGQAVVLGPVAGNGNARLSTGLSGIIGTN
ncbi:MAG: hypothetical protein ABL963_17600 [Longimicrobiales bacterium]